MNVNTKKQARTKTVKTQIHKNYSPSIKSTKSKLILPNVNKQSTYIHAFIPAFMYYIHTVDQENAVTIPCYIFMLVLPKI